MVRRKLSWHRSTPPPPRADNTFSVLTLYSLIGASVLCSWTILRCMGNDRERQINSIKEKVRAEQEALAAVASAAPALPAKASNAPKSPRH